VGGRIRARRIGLQFSQAVLSEALGVTFQQVQKYENGTNRVGASTLYRIAAALDVNMDYFFDGLPASLALKNNAAGMGVKPSRQGLSDTGADTATVFGSDPMASREGIQLVHNYFRIMDESVRRQLFQFVKAISRGGKG